MAKSLTPKQAAELAQGVYGIRVGGEVKGAFAKSEARNIFDLENRDARLTGRSGGVFGCDTGFGVVSRGQGVRSNELLIVTRGTEKTSVNDWYSNAMATWTLSGKPVHTGFNKIFQTFQSELGEKISGMDISRVHCVGHSLGGALANLVADWMLSKNLAKEAEVYTFGAPRVGFKRFAESLTTSVSAARIHRVYHHSDVVPMLPVWPFWHGPEPGDVCYVRAAGESDRPGAEYHDMKHYVKSMKRFSSWDNVQKKAPPTHMDKQVEAWLASDSSLSFTTNTFSLIRSSMLYIVKQAAALGMQLVVGVGVHVVDALAGFLIKVVDLGKRFVDLVASLMRRILQTLGVVVVESANVTYQFVKWVLHKLSATLWKMAELAMRMTHND